MPTQLRTPAVSIDKQGPSQLQQLAGPTLQSMVMVYAQYYSSLITNLTKIMYHGTCLLSSNAR